MIGLRVAAGAAAGAPFAAGLSDTPGPRRRMGDFPVANSWGVALDATVRSPGVLTKPLLDAGQLSLHSPARQCRGAFFGRRPGAAPGPAIQKNAPAPGNRGKSVCEIRQYPIHVAEKRHSRTPSFAVGSRRPRGLPHCRPRAPSHFGPARPAVGAFSLQPAAPGRTRLAAAASIAVDHTAPRTIRSTPHLISASAVRGP